MNINGYNEQEYRKALKELLVILENIPEIEYQKIPPEVRETIKTNADDTYDFKIQQEKDLKDQISEITKALLENFYRDYWVTDAEKEKIREEERKEKMDIENEKAKNYRFNDIFGEKK